LEVRLALALEYPLMQQGGLGLGLYVAQLIAEFHGGEIHARNLASGDGVAVSATFRPA
jgi:signal transduction histidine kinase